MEGRLWLIVMDVLRTFDEGPGSYLYPDRDIVMIWLWAILHDRPIVWACCVTAWPTAQRPLRLPHASTVSRRLRSQALQEHIACLHAEVVKRLTIAREAILDGKPLIVSDLSKDPEAKIGRGTRGMARGYKLHALVSGGHVIAAFEVQPLNQNERLPAKRLLRQLPRGVRRVLADGNYDGAPLHRCLEGAGVRLYTPILNHYAGPHTHRRRRVLVRLMDHPIGQKLQQLRDRVEAAFGLLGNTGFGLKGLPNWVRRLGRVQRWVSGKVLIHNVYLLAKQTAS